MSDCRKCAEFSWCLENEDCGLFKQKPQTNADSIRSMTDEMLAYYITMFMECDECILKDAGNCVDVITCQNAWLDWLKQEVKDGD